MEKYICIHGHFYQPPRENAWLEEIELQDSAHPYHDWNERISAECYAPNTASRILNGQGVIKNILNNYSRISFNVGPTLLSWLEMHDPGTYEAVLTADKESQNRYGGHGSAIAQVYNHMIMPLANSKDKETQIIWGIRDFESRFNRKPEGMWLAETAVDLETLEFLVNHDIKYTILAPRQAHAVKLFGRADWQDVHENSLDTKRPYTCKLPSGKEIALFFYNGDISQEVAFKGLLNDGKKFVQTLVDSFESTREGNQLVHLATDGETYGHHHKHGDMALAYCLDYIERNENYSLTNYGEFLSISPPVDEVKIRENSAWSCVHGVERWRNDCGCNTGGNPSWNQSWRKPLRDTLDWLRDELVDIFLKEGEKILYDPWLARRDYVQVILNRNHDSINNFLKEHGKSDVSPNKVLRLLEMQRHAMLMYTSCGWFFDEISGIETIQILQYACRAIQLANQISNRAFEDEFVAKLEKCPSNIAELQNGAQVYKKYVEPSKINLKRVGAHYAVSCLFEKDPESFPIFNYQTENEFFVRKEAGEQRLVVGLTKIRSKVTWSEKKFAFAAIYLGKHNIIGSISLNMEKVVFDEMCVGMLESFEEGRLGDLIGLLQQFFGQEKYTLWQLFNDEKRKVLDLITEQSLEEMRDSLRRIYNRDYPLVNALVQNDIPMPNAYRTTFEFILNNDLLNCFKTERIDVRELERIGEELKKWNLSIEDPSKVARLAGDSIFKELKRISAERGNHKRLHRLNSVLPLLKQFNLSPNFYKSQNLYFEIHHHKISEYSEEWLKEFIQLGDNLGVKVEN